MKRSGQRWTGWAVTGAVHVGMLIALVSAFAPTRVKLPTSTSISARLLPASPTKAAMATSMTPLLIALPHSALLVPPSSEIPPPPVQISTAPPPPSVAAATTPMSVDAPTAAGTPNASFVSTAPAHATTVAMAVPVNAQTPPPAPPPTQSQSETPAAFPADHRLCSERQTARHYPAMLRERGIQGQVLLRVKVDADGRAAEVVVAGGSGFRLLDEAARRVAESCPYLPARRGDQKLVSWVEYPVRFALQPSTLQ